MSIKKITTRDRIKDVAKRWKKQYPNDKEETYIKLKGLNPLMATKADVDYAIGNNTWTTLDCDICSREVGAVIVIKSINDESMELCTHCVEAASKLMEKVE